MLSKKILIVTTTAGILLALSLSAESKQEASLKTQNTPISAKESQDETLYLETYGWLLGRQGGLVEYGITPEELKSVIKGFKAAGEGAPPPANPQDVGPKMQEFLNQKANAYGEKRKKELASQAAQNEKAADAFIEKERKQNKDIKQTESGLYYQIVKEGNAPKPTAADKVEINYKGALINGEVFDSTYDRGEPIVFEVDKFIPGMREGLQLIGETGQIRLYIPAKLAYGSQELPGIPAGSMLVFDVELKEVIPAKQTASTETAPQQTKQEG
tara:strand:+ start:238 stop:1053 length:816 start_codon:yes stop_codon:yes gene_type:complete